MLQKSKLTAVDNPADSALSNCRAVKDDRYAGRKPRLQSDSTAIVRKRDRFVGANEDPLQPVIGPKRKEADKGWAMLPIRNFQCSK